MEEIQLDAQVRNEKGNRGARKVRRQDCIPAVVYGEGQKSAVVKIDRRVFERLERQHKAESVVLHLNILEGDKKLKDYATIIKEIQHDPVTDRILHIDFNRISLTKEIEVKVPVNAKGDEPIGVKEEDGSLDHPLWELDIVCLPTNIPEKIEVEVNHLKIGDAIHVKDLVLPPGVKTKHDPEDIVFSVVPPMREIEEEPVEEEGEGAEPEVIKEKKEPKEGEGEVKPVKAKQEKKEESKPEGKSEKKVE